MSSKDKSIRKAKEAKVADSGYDSSLNSIQGQSFLKLEKKQELDDDLEDAPKVQQQVVNNPTKKTKNTGSLTQNKPTPQEKKPEYKVSDDGEDIFDEDGSVYEEEEKALTKKIREIQEKVDQIIDFITDKLANIINKVKSVVFGILNKIITPFSIIFEKLVEPILSRFRGSKKEEEVKNEEEKPKEPKTLEETFEIANFAKMTEINVIFTDNYDVAMYKPKKDSFAVFTKAEENIIMEIALRSVKECSSFMEGQPILEAGFYAGKTPLEVMDNVTEQDIKLFLGYVTAVPEMYTSQKWKISETFATWIVSNAPMVEKP